MDPGEYERRLYIGNIATLTPSGKMYTCFANSNINRCHRCKGDGYITNPKKINRRRVSYWINQYDKAAKRYEKAPCQSNKDKFRQARYNFTKLSHSEEIECPACEGIGSIEVLMDQKWWEVLNSECEDHGVSYDCDNDNVFITQYCTDEHDGKN